MCDWQARAPTRNSVQQHKHARSVHIAIVSIKRTKFTFSFFRLHVVDSCSEEPSRKAPGRYRQDHMRKHCNSDVYFYTLNIVSFLSLLHAVL